MLRIRLFFYYSFVAFYALFKPQECLAKEHDAQEMRSIREHQEMMRRRISLGSEAPRTDVEKD